MKNAIYNILSEYKCWDFEEKITQENKKYLFIKLPKMELPIDSTWLTTVNHHFSIYQYQAEEKNSFLSSYHYTATVVFNDERYKLHLYFNYSGQWLRTDIKNIHNDSNNLLHFNESQSQNLINYVDALFGPILTAAIETQQTKLEELGAEIKKDLDQLADLSKNLHESNVKRRYLEQSKQTLEKMFSYERVCFHDRYKSMIKYFEKLLETDINENITIEKNNASKKKKSKRKKKIVLKTQQTPAKGYVDLAPLKARLNNYIAQRTTHRLNPAELIEYHAHLQLCFNAFTADQDILTIAVEQNAVLFEVELQINLCALKNNTDHLQKLLEISQEVSFRPLHLASGKGHLATLKILFPALKNSIFFKLGTSLLEQCWHGNQFETLGWLLEQGIDPNAPDPRGITLLMRAVGTDNIELAEQLLKHGADPNYCQKAPRYSIMLLSNKQHTTAIQNFFKPPEKDFYTTALMLAKSERMIKLLLDCERTDMYLRSADGFTAFGQICFRSRNNKEKHFRPILANLFVKKNYRIDDLQGRPGKEMTPLGFACQEGYPEAAAFLVKQGADPFFIHQHLATSLNTEDTRNYMPICNAILRNATSVVEAILNNLVLTLENIDKYMYAFAVAKQHVALSKICPRIMDLLNKKIDEIDDDKFPEILLRIAEYAPQLKLTVQLRFSP